MLVNAIYGKGHSYQVIMSLISSHTRKPTVDMFSQREFLIKIFWLLVFDSYNFRSSHVETCVLLSHKSADDFISVKMEYADDRKIQPDRITYRLIQEYIEEKYGFKVHTANIAEVKRNLGLPMYDAPNAVEELKRPYKPAPEYKVEAIKDALRHFKVID
ncbi:TPA: hypothetical protein ACGO5I_002091 [Streptococcus suis]